MLETGIAAWDRADNADGRLDSLTLGDATMRVGLDQQTELQVGFTSFVHQRSRDGAGGVASSGGSGDATLGLRHGITGPNGRAAVQAFVTLPVGHGPGTAGDWGAGVLVPVALPLPQGFELDLTPQADAAVNASGAGRHLAYGGVVGLAHDLAPRLSGTMELAAFRDDDPGGHSTDARLAASVAWQAGAGLQLDLEVDKGLSAAAPDHTIAFGIAWRVR